MLIPLNCCEALASAPLGRSGETSDITSVALCLAADAASWITEHTIVPMAVLLPSQNHP